MKRHALDPVGCAALLLLLLNVGGRFQTRWGHIERHVRRYAKSRGGVPKLQ